MKTKTKTVLAVIIFLLCVFILINIIPQKDATAVNCFRRNENINIVSKSGAGKAYPENVASAFTAAAYSGIKHFEIGVVLSSDNVLIVADTNNLSYYTGEEGKISDFTYEELRSKNFAYNYTPDNGVSYPYRMQNIMCIKLDTMFSTYFNSDYIINIVSEGQEGIKTATILCELIRQYGYTTRIVIKGSEEVIDAVRAEENVTAFTAGNEKEINLFSDFARFRLSNLVFSIKYQYIEIDINQTDGYTANMIQAFQKRNICVYISGVETKEQLEHAQALSADGVICDDVEELLNLLNEEAASF